MILKTLPAEDTKAGALSQGATLNHWQLDVGHGGNICNLANTTNQTLLIVFSFSLS